MKIINTPQKMQETAQRWRKKGLTLGLIPTMGSLHEGHLSLVEAAVRECDIVVMSIFVNPAQFGPSEDYQTYPRNLAKDSRKAYKGGVDCIFAPSAADMYPENYATYTCVEGLSEKLCGKSRPGHFRGVATVVLKLFNIVMPHKAYFGQKDAQQFAVLKKMVDELNFPVILHSLPIIREDDGLAKSSRNQYLNEDQREQAIVISKALDHGKTLFMEGVTSAEKIIAEMRGMIEKAPSAKIDYLEIVDEYTLESLVKVQEHALICAAVFIGKTRLIDNLLLL